VPRVTALFAKIPGVKIVGKDVKVPIECLYDKKSVGQDRLVAAYAAKKFYPGTRIVVDFGTAITLDFVSIRGEYEGGIILPGIGSTLRVFANCAMLPNSVHFKSSRLRVPRHTQESINLGMQLGFSSMINSLVLQYKDTLKIPRNTKVVLTGGDGGFLCNHFDFPHIIDKNLIFKGLAGLAI